MRHYNGVVRKLGTHRSKRVRGRPANETARVALEVAPTAAVVALACGTAWWERGSIAAQHWLPYALVGLLVLAGAAFGGMLRRPSWAAAVAAGGLALLGCWAALSILWTPVPALARDEALLTLLYAVAVAVPALTLRRGAARVAAVGVVVAALTAVSLAAALELWLGDDQLGAFREKGRLYFPIGYVNAQAAMALLAFWPAVMLAARRNAHPLARALWLGAAALATALALPTQSRGGAIALGASVLLVLALVPARLRLVVPAAVPLALTALAFDPLTRPFGATVARDPALADVIAAAGRTALAVAAGAAVLGLVYALVDRRVALPQRATRVVGAALAAAVVVAAAGGAATFAARVDDPRGWLTERWEAFKQEPEDETAATHFLNPGSNRYDFWRVALADFRDHPLRGEGARSFGPSYLLRGRSSETPTRAHSLVFEQLGEHGLIGFGLLTVALGAAVGAAFAGRARVPAAAALAAACYWLPHASVDWIWNFPACTVPFLALLGIGLSREERRLPARPQLAIGVGVLLLAAAAFAPPWLASRFVDRGSAAGLPAGAADFDRATTLDPLGTDALLVRAQLEADPLRRIELLREAVEREPRTVRTRYLLGLALLDAGRTREARAELLRARSLYPGSVLVAEALARTR